MAANLCSELNDLTAAATPDTYVAEDAPTLEEIIRAVRRLQNGRAAGSDKIAPELLKYAEAPISQALHDLFSTVWSSGKVPAEWKEGIIVSQSVSGTLDRPRVVAPSKTCGHVRSSRRHWR